MHVDQCLDVQSLHSAHPLHECPDFTSMYSCKNACVDFEAPQWVCGCLFVEITVCEQDVSTS